MPSIRSSSRSRLTLASARARGAPGHNVDTMAEGQVLAGVRPSGVELVGQSNLRESRFAAPFNTMTVVPAGIPHARLWSSAARDRRKSPFTGTLETQASPPRSSGSRCGRCAKTALEIADPPPETA